MANIKGYDAPQNLGLNPTEIGADATAAAARRLGAYGNQIADTKNQEGKAVGSAVADAGADAVNYMDHREISAGAAKSSEMWMNLTQAWENTKKQLVDSGDVNDPSVAKKFIAEQVEPALQQFQEGFNTEKSQQFAEQKVNALRQHFFESTSADMSTLAKIAVNKNINDSTTAMSNTAILDPSSVPALLKGMDHSVEGMLSANPNISAIDAAKVRADVSEASKKAIVQAGAIGAIQKSSNPEATADQWIRKYPDYIGGADAKTLAGNARQQIRANNYDFELNRRREKEVATDKSNEATNNYMLDIAAKDPRLANDPTSKKVLNDPTLLKSDKNHLLNYLRTVNKPEAEAQISQQTFVGLLRDMRKPNADPDQVMEKAWEARAPSDENKPSTISEKDFNQFRQEVVARKTPEGAELEQDRTKFFHNYATAITGDRNYDPKIGDPKLYAAEMDARRVEKDLRKRDLDPHLAYDPSSQYYLGKPERTAKWAGNMQQDLQLSASFKDRFGNMPPAASKAPPPPKVGDIQNGYKYLGGSPGSASSWAKVQ